MQLQVHGAKVHLFYWFNIYLPPVCFTGPRVAPHIWSEVHGQEGDASNVHEQQRLRWPGQHLFLLLCATAFTTDVLKKTDLFPCGENPFRMLHDSNPWLTPQEEEWVFFSLLLSSLFVKVGVLSAESPLVADLMWCDSENVSGWGGMTGLVVRTV